MLHGSLALRGLPVLVVGDEQSVPFAVGIRALFPQHAVAVTPVFALPDSLGEVYAFLVRSPQDAVFARQRTFLVFQVIHRPLLRVRNGPQVAVLCNPLREGTAAEQREEEGCHE